MSIDAPKPRPAPEIDYADHTLEVDTSYLFVHQPELRALAEDQPAGPDLDDAQVNELLNKDKK